MPTIVDAIASATGKSAEEIRKLGVQGKLSLDDINTGLLRTVEVNRKAAADMSVSVQDALVNIQNSITTFAAGIEEGTGALDLLASALGVVANNVEWLAGLVGGALVGALTLYSARAAVATAATLKSAAGALTERNARIAQADAILQAAVAE
ncbi:tail tape measure protein, partial [Pseudomonas aeruginosa]